MKYRRPLSESDAWTLLVCANAALVLLVYGAVYLWRQIF